MNPDGSFSLVYRSNSDKIAIAKSMCSVEEIGITSLREIDVISRLQHPYIIHANDLELKDGIIMTYLPLSDRTLADITLDVSITTEVKLPILYKIAKGLSFLHEQNIIYRNIHAKNICLQGTSPRLMDFSMSLYVPDRYCITTEAQNTEVYYSAPEVIIGSCSFASDIWSLGILYMQTLSGVHNYTAGYKIDTLNDFLLLLRTIFDGNMEVSRELAGVRSCHRDLSIDLITRMLQLDDKNRIPILGVLNHPLFSCFSNSRTGKCVSTMKGGIPELSPEHRNVLKILFHWGKNLYPTETAELLFLASDIYNRMGGPCAKRSVGDLLMVAAASLWMAKKYISNGPIAHSTKLTQFVKDIIPVVPDITASFPTGIDLNKYMIDKLPSVELHIVSTLQGVLNESCHYRDCVTDADALFIFQHLLATKDSTLYFTASAKDLLIKVSDTSKRTKNELKIQDLL